jgi:hypothetical protein
VHRKTDKKVRRKTRRNKAHCRSAPSVPINVTGVFRRREMGKRDRWRARVSWDFDGLDVGGRAINAERAHVQMRATDASGDPVETTLQDEARVAMADAFSVHAGSAALSTTNPKQRDTRELNASPDEIKKTITGLTTGIATQVNFYALEKADGDAPRLKFEIWNVTDGVSVASKNETLSGLHPKLYVSRTFTPAAGKTYEARVSWVSGTGIGLFHHIQWHDLGEAAVWNKYIDTDDDEIAVFQDIARPKTWFYQFRVRIMNRVGGHRCFSAWSAWTTPINPGHGTYAGPPPPTGLTQVIDKVDGTRRAPWRVRSRWNEAPWWVAPDDDAREGVDAYDVKLEISNNGGSTVSARRVVRVPASIDVDNNATAQKDWTYKIHGKRHYRSFVRSVANGRKGAYSSPTAWASPGGAPNPVQNLTWSNITPATLYAEWDDPVDVSDIDRFRVRVFRQPGAVLVKDRYIYGNSFRYHIPPADRDNNHFVRVNALEEEASLDEDDIAPSGYTAGDAASDVTSADVANTEQWGPADVTPEVLAGSDGNPPPDSPDVELIPGLGVVHARWPGTVNADPVTYEVHVDDATITTPDAGTLYAETDATAITIKALPDGTPLPYAANVFVKLFAKDEDGGGYADPTPAAGAEASAQPAQVNSPDIVAESIISTLLAAGSITTEKLAAVLIITTILKTAVSGRRVEIDGGADGGVRLIDTDESVLVNIPLDPETPASFNGEILAQALTVLGPAEFRSALSTLTKDAMLTLLSGQEAPAAAPALTQHVPSSALNWDDTLGNLIGIMHAQGSVGYSAASGLYAWYAKNNGGSYTNTVERRTSDGLTVHSIAVLSMANTQNEIRTLAKVGIYWYALVYLTNTSEVKWHVWDDTGGGNGSSITLSTSAAADDIIDTSTPHGFSIGERVKFTALTGGSGLSVGTTYYVVPTSFGGSTFRVATTPHGTPINFTTDITAGTVRREGGLPGTRTANATWAEWNDAGFSKGVAITPNTSAGLAVAQSNLTFLGGSTAAWLGMYTVPGNGNAPNFTSNVTSNVTGVVGSAGIQGIYFGQADGLGGADRWVLRCGSNKNSIRVFSTAGTEQTSHAFESAETNVSTPRGFTWDGDFFIEPGASSDVLHSYGEPTTGVSQQFWLAFTWADSDATGGTHETALSPRATITLKNRRVLILTWPTIPDAGGTDDPNAVRVYMKANATDPGSAFGSYFRQGGYHTGVGVSILAYSTATAGSQDTNFASGNGALIRSNNGEWQLRGDGTAWGLQMLGEPLSRGFGFGDEMTYAGAQVSNNTIVGPVTLFLTGAGAEMRGSGADGVHMGVVEFNTGTTTTGNSRLVGGGMVTGLGRIRFACMIKSPTNKPTTAQNYVVYAGFHAGADPLGANIEQCSILFRRTSDTVMRTEVRMGNGVSAASTTLVADEDTNWHLYEFEINADASAVDFYRDGTFLTTVTANIPDGEVNPRIGIDKTAGTTARIMFLDYYSYQGELDTPR